MNDLDHLIAKHGVMSSFSIARKISKNEFEDEYYFTMPAISSHQ